MLKLFLYSERINSTIIGDSFTTIKLLIKDTKVFVNIT